jgi:hypothetical protein
MAALTWSQDIFSKGELSPLLYGRVTVTAYYNGVKSGRNCITYPQGGIGKRFGTLYQNVITGVTDYRQIFFDTFEYLNECTYILVIIPDSIQIYLEGILVATVAATGITAAMIPQLDTTILENRFRVSSGVNNIGATAFRPRDLLRTANAANAIVTAAADLLTLTNALTSGTIYPVQFTTTGTLPTTVPQVTTNKTYFLYMTGTTTAELYGTAEEAKARENKYTITNNGAGTNNAYVLNTWAFSNVNFKNVPVYDFENNYSAISFTPGAQLGYNITLTASAPIFTTGMVGGAFAGNGGVGRIISWTSTTVVNMNIVQSFDSTAAIPGDAALLTEPAWSNERGWPSRCSSFQSRSVFANTPLLPNGLWLSVINDYANFDGLLLDDDDSISYYPTSDNINYIKFIVPYRSLTIHTNTGIYSTPLSFEQAVTPTNFSMTLQDSTPATAIQPRGIDNQIIIVSGNDIHSMLWDGFNNAYSSSIASIANEHLIRNPHDESEYVDLNKAGSRYMFFINDDGSLIIFQTLISDDVQGFTPQYLDQSYGNAYFRWATASTGGRGWFVTEREIAEAALSYDITDFTSDTLETTTSWPTEEPRLIQFTTTGSLPTSTPQIELSTWYWALSAGGLFATIYLTEQDARDGVAAIEFSDAGTNSKIQNWPLVTKFYLEELSFDVFTDCSQVYSGVATSTLAGIGAYVGQDIQIQGDGYGFEVVPTSTTVNVEAHGAAVEVTEAFYGFPIDVEIIPLPIAPPGTVGAKGSGMVWEQNIRSVQLMFADTISGEVNGVPIQLNKFSQVLPNVAPIPRTGVFKISPMKGWDMFNVDALTITHRAPFDIKLIGIFYRVEV